MTAVDAESVTTIDQRGTQRVLPLNPFLPLTAWRQGDTMGQHAVDVGPDYLWPPVLGESRKYQDTYTVTDGNTGEVRRYLRNWECTVSEVGPVAVASGVFESVTATCYRYGRQKAVQRRTITYAPTLGKVLKTREDYFYSRDSRQQELVAVLPDLDAVSRGTRNVLNKQMQGVLETQAQGQTATRWLGRLKSEILPVATLRTSKGGYCRRYHWTISGSAAIAGEYPGLACRSGDGVWRVPGTDE
ncbi:MAG: hypothetical protein ACPGO3_07985 [Magnetospiraceae bacterium]